MAPMDFLRQLRDYYTKGPEPEPPLSAKIVAVLSIGFTLFYVVPFYLSSTTRPSPRTSRDLPSVIRARIQFVTTSCAFSALITVYVLTQYVHASRYEVLRLLGWWPVGILEIVRSMLLTALLFAGPLYERGIVEGGWRRWITCRPLFETLGDWTGWRNYVAGPITEELLFRSLLTPLALLTPAPPTRSIFLTPLYFGIAHVHHFYEFHLTHSRVPLLPALLRTMVQFGYTTLFGWYANFVFVRTGSLPAVVLAHAFCNWMGLPRLWGRLETEDGRAAIERPLTAPLVVERAPSPMKRAGKAEAGRARAERELLAEDPLASGSRSRTPRFGRLGLGWTVAYYVLLFAGAGAFWKALWPLTESPRRLAHLWE